MGDYNLKFSPIDHFFTFLIFFFFLHISVHAQVDVCAKVYCGQGTCVPGGSILGYDCACNTGWKKFQMGPLTLPPCILPNCTINFPCSDGASPSPLPSPAPAPAPLPPPPLNLTSPCNLIWCGDGTCVTNGTGHTCLCNEGSTNLLNSTDLACLNKCALGADCSGLGLGPFVTPPSVPPPSTIPSPPPPNGTILLPSPPQPPPPPSNGTLLLPPQPPPSNGTLLLPPQPPLGTSQPVSPNGSNISKCSRRLDAQNMVLLSAVILALIA